MKSFSLTLILLLWTACATPPAAETPTPTPAPASTELIEFESLTFPGHLWTPFMPPVAEGTAVTVTGALSIPASNRPVPAIVLTHGCGSITAGELAWAERLNERGVAALLVHSFGARHIPEGMRILSGGLIVYVLDCTTAVNTYNSAWQCWPFLLACL